MLSEITRNGNSNAYVIVQSYFPIGATNIKTKTAVYPVPAAIQHLLTYLCRADFVSVVNYLFFPTLLQDVPKYLNLHN